MFFLHLFGHRLFSFSVFHMIFIAFWRSIFCFSVCHAAFFVIAYIVFLPFLHFEKCLVITYTLHNPEMNIAEELHTNIRPATLEVATKVKVLTSSYPATFRI